MSDPQTRIQVDRADFDLTTEQNWLLQDNSQDGAMVSFVGQVRDFNLDSEVSGLFLEHYPAMTEKSLAEIAQQARKRWPVSRINIYHRVGQLYPADKIVFVGVTSIHRQSAFESCQFIMDFLKTRAPFWKKETGESGERWIEARDSDAHSANKWQK